MSTITIRGLDATIVDRLKKRARSHHRSLEAEAREILSQEASFKTNEEWFAEAERLRNEVTPWQPGMPTAVELVREGRDEDR